MRVIEMARGGTAGHSTVRASVTGERTAVPDNQRQKATDGNPHAIMTATSGLDR